MGCRRLEQSGGNVADSWEQSLVKRFPQRCDIPLREQALTCERELDAQSVDEHYDDDDDDDEHVDLDDVRGGKNDEVRRSSLFARSGWNPAFVD
ncbi:hypothetical protein CYMTET_39930 [Cymbomonas tetramitiformis]|uniref:Uncharacterized protein n=1 Tax=Cymbomonas tetramitiformis TaxID=36881 RepID=A0AAE0CAI2_9CHLO|nr:hypothetical protein CYMTET_39930 [Cymbomonas tetramitiformis]